MRIAIIGAGAAGIYLALALKKKRPDYQVTLFEREKKLGKKLAATGNGRCNLLHCDPEAEAYDHPEFIAPYLKAYSTGKLVDFLGGFGIGVSELEDTGLLYPDSFSAPNHVAYLAKLLKELGVEIRLEAAVKDYDADKKVLMTSQGDFPFDHLVFACGGKSGKNLGTDGSLFPVLARHGYRITDTFPSLCPIKTQEKTASLSGIRHTGEVRLEDGYASKGEILFKNDGLSGIAVFDAQQHLESKRMPKGSKVTLDLFPDKSLETLQKEWKTYACASSFYQEALFPKPLADYLCQRNKGNEAASLARLAKSLEFHFDGSYRFEDSQVTLGGVALSEIDADLLSKKESCVSFIGEILDIAGRCGGYNLTWALISALVVSEKL